MCIFQRRSDTALTDASPTKAYKYAAKSIFSQYEALRYITNMMTLGQLLYFSRISAEAFPMIDRTIRARWEQYRYKLSVLVQKEGPYRLAEPCFGRGSTEYLINSQDFGFYTSEWDRSQTYLFWLFKRRSSSLFKIIKCLSGSFNESWRLTTSPQVRSYFSC